MKKKTAIQLLDDKLQGGAVADRPKRKSFVEFLLNDAKVPGPGGVHERYSFQGREALREPVTTVDEILDRKLANAILAIAGGAQFGKTIFELNLMAYVTAQLFYNAIIFLPDKDLAAGVIDAKYRPDVVDQIPYLARMMQIGRIINESGKAVDRKGAFTVTDGKARAQGMAMGLQKTPTTFSADVIFKDECDDIPEQYGKFAAGRMGASKLSLELRFGTQRVNGRGMNKAWKDGSQGVVELAGINPEEAFPGVVRCQIGATPSKHDPKLTWAADFRHDADPNATVATHNPDRVYYLAHPETGEPLNRRAPIWVHRKPEQIAMRNWSYRISQLSIDAISLSKIVAQFQLAVNDPQDMIVFRCDVLALPQSSTQAITPFVMDRARDLEPFDMRNRPVEGRPVYGGIDVGDKSYFIAKERESAKRKRIIYAATMPSADIVTRGVSLFHAIGLSCLFIDQRPEASKARSLALALNGLADLRAWPAIPEGPEAYLRLPGGLIWNGRKQRWENLRCAVVRFDKKQEGAGIEHAFDEFDEGGLKKFVPLIKCNRQDSIDRVVRELLTPDEGVVEHFDGIARQEPMTLLPRRSTAPIIDEVCAHFITGSERERKEGKTEIGDYVDGCANHFLLADAYSALAEGENLNGVGTPPGKFMPMHRSNRFARGMAERRDRRVIA
jgi:hypothetical protein